MSAALTPRVRTIVICDDRSASMTEFAVFNLEGVRIQLLASGLPCRKPLSVFMLLSNPPGAAIFRARLFRDCPRGRRVSVLACPFLLGNKASEDAYPTKCALLGQILIVDELTERPIRYIKFSVEFAENNQLLPQ